jgi:hypothetical protein
MMMCDCGSHGLVCRQNMNNMNIKIYNIINLEGRADLAGRRSAIISQFLWHSTEVEGGLLLARELEQSILHT